MIHIQHLTKRYGRKTVVDNLSFEIAPGECVALWGPNGAGKTTILRCLLGLVAFDGEITVGGLDARRQGKAARRLLGHVPQELSFFDDLAVADTLAFSAELRGVGPDRVGEVIDRLGLGAQQAKPVGALSGGMKQRLALALALLADPPILLLDEPTSNLDAAARESAMSLLESLRHAGRNLILTSHHFEEVGALVDRVIALEDGRIVHDGAPADLAHRLGARFTLHLLVADSQVDPALAVLLQQGFAARRNGQGLLVEVAPREKGAAFGALHGAGITVKDFEIWQ